jgi:hypothetical protein
LRIHFQQNEIGETAFAETPSGAEASDTSPNDYDWNFFCALRWWKRGVVPQEMAHLKGIIHEGARDGSICFERKSNEGCAASAEKFTAPNLQ